MTRPSANFTWPRFRPDGGLLLPLSVEQFLTGLPPSLAWQGPTLKRKDECHVTVLNRACGSAARDALGEARVQHLFEDQEWTLHRTGDARLLRKSGTPDAFSLIEELDLPSLNAFRQALSLAMSADLPAVPPHVTLYTARKPEGIGLPDRQTLAKLEIARLRLPGITNRHPPALSSALRQAYRATRYSVEAGSGLDIRIGEHSPTTDALLDTHHAHRALLLSACNPFSEAGSETANQLRYGMLEAAVQSLGLAVLPAEGRDPTDEWPPEASLLLIGTTPGQELRLLRDYEQHAAVLLQHGHPAELLYHPGGNQEYSAA
ncbi:MAG: DUF3293 domain-containing protein [Luteimonas sp.]